MLLPVHVLKCFDHVCKCCCHVCIAVAMSEVLLSPCGGWPHLDMAGRGGGSDPLWQHHLLGLQQFTLTTHTQSLIRGPLSGRTYTNITIIYQGSGSGSSMVHIIWAPDPGSDLVLNKKSEKKRKKLSCKNSLGTRIQ